MTKEFQEMVTRLAIGRNFEDSSFCLITNIHNVENVDVRFKGNAEKIGTGVLSVIEQIFNKLNDDESIEFSEKLKSQIVIAENRRFQNKKQ